MSHRCNRTYSYYGPLRRQAHAGIPWRALLLMGIGLSTFALATIGCSTLDRDSAAPDELDSLVSEETRSESTETRPTRTRGSVRWDGGGVNLGTTNNAAIEPAALLHQLDELLENKRLASATQLVRSYPDVVIQTLSEADPTTQSDAALNFLAQAADHWFVDSSTQWWQAYVQDCRDSQNWKASLPQLRSEYWKSIEIDEPEIALKSKLFRKLPASISPATQAEILRLEAIGEMFADNPTAAVNRLEQAVRLVAGHNPYYATKLKLLLGEFYRHAGQLDLWKDAWGRAVSEHAILAAETGLEDPGFWTRAAGLRPVDMDWPQQAISQLGTALPLVPAPDAPEHPEVTIWSAVGYFSYQRAEGQNGVLAFKKAEAIAQKVSTQRQARLQQARCMVAAGQPGPASVILIQLISIDENSVLGDRAQAVLGSLKLENGGIAQGINLLQTAVQSIDSWPGDEQLNTKADYALALLIRGQEQDGLDLLAAIHDEFLARQEFSSARQCLVNRLTYFEKSEQPREAATARLALEQFEQTALSY